MIYLGLGCDDASALALDNLHRLILDNLGEKYGLTEHLANITVKPINVQPMKKRMARKMKEYERFRSVMQELDPNGKFLSGHAARIVLDPEIGL